MIQVADNFNYRGKKPNFDRDSFDTLQSMKNYSDNNMDEGHISYCIETDKHYKYNSNNDIDSTTGKFREFIEGVLPDEEDITSNNDDKLKFADRKYNPEKFSGKGYKILRKNIQDGKNILSQSMINQQNTVYEIRYDYDLDNQEITIPEGSTLKFEGGNLSNGTILGNYTEINSKSINVLLKGTFTYKNKLINNINKEVPIKEIPDFAGSFGWWQNTSWTEENTKTVKYLKECGINKIVICGALLGNEDSSVEINFPIQSIIDNIKNIDIEVEALKFHIDGNNWHCSKSDEIAISNYANKVIEAIQQFENNGIKINVIYILNEWKETSVNPNPTNKNTVLNLIQRVKDLGKKVSISYQGYVNMINADIDIIKAIDYPSFNWYPRLFFGEDDNVKDDMDFSDIIKENIEIYNKNINALDIQNIKYTLNISEIGISYQIRGLAHPASANDDPYWGYKREGYLSQVYVFYKSLFKALRSTNMVNKVYFWYSNILNQGNVKELIKEYFYE